MLQGWYEPNERRNGTYEGPNAHGRPYDVPRHEPTSQGAHRGPGHVWLWEGRHEDGSKYPMGGPMMYRGMNRPLRGRIGGQAMYGYGRGGMRMAVSIPWEAP